MHFSVSYCEKKESSVNVIAHSLDTCCHEPLACLAMFQHEQNYPWLSLQCVLGWNMQRKKSTINQEFYVELWDWAANYLWLWPRTSWADPKRYIKAWLLIHLQSSSTTQNKNQAWWIKPLLNIIQLHLHGSLKNTIHLYHYTMLHVFLTI